MQVLWLVAGCGILKEADGVHGAIYKLEEEESKLSERSSASFCDRFKLINSNDEPHSALLLTTASRQT
jgi:hypothetical protein